MKKNQEIYNSRSIMTLFQKIYVKYLKIDLTQFKKPENVF